MASGQVLAKMRDLYAKMDAEVKTWNELQEESLALLRTISHVISRLPVLQDSGNYGALGSVPDIQQKLLQKQLVGLEKTFTGLHSTLSKLEGACCAMEKLASKAQRAVQQEKGLTAAVRAATAGPIPSVDQCLQGLQQIWQMHADELKLKYAIVSEVQYDNTEEELQQLVAVYAGDIKIRSTPP